MRWLWEMQAVLLCYDVTNYQSFQDLEDWYRLVKQTHEKDSMPLVALIGNKSAWAAVLHSRAPLRLVH